MTHVAKNPLNANFESKIVQSLKNIHDKVLAQKQAISSLWKNSKLQQSLQALGYTDLQVRGVVD